MAISAVFRERLVNTILSVPPFRSGDFRIVADSAGSSKIRVTVTYQYDDEIWFKAVFDASATRSPQRDKIGVNLQPGEVARLDKFSLGTIDDLVASFHSWLASLPAEIEAADRIAAAIRAEEEAVAEFFDQFGEVPDEPFSDDELTTLASALDKLRARLEEAERERGKTEADIENRITTLEQEIAMLKSRATSLKKPVWIRLFTSRLAVWLQDPKNRRLLEWGGGMIKGLLTSGGNGSANSGAHSD